ncbi:hypothetical protein KIN20_022662 [Parelaphostrongylus tenuis]|uniref:FAM69 protein-kinase domain-containing protein n=1 Tax=Parelaphostrongylus tenuis TaxID=148309 RepID=A0AAD5QUY7_PARTN|nr:hypothetical protein KIN20_022662 [Parelaphostrongylus tenuis]
MEIVPMRYNSNIDDSEDSEEEDPVLGFRWSRGDTFIKSPGDWFDDEVRALVCSKPGRLLITLLLMIFVYLAFIVFSSNRAVTVLGVDGPEPSTKVNKTRAIDILTELCDSFRDGLISGDSCNRLCYNREWKISDYYEGNKVVLILKDGGQTAVFKSLYPSMNDFSPLDENLSYDEFSDMILNLINDELRLGWPHYYKKHLMDILWPTLRRTPGEPMSGADRASLWALLQQPEFILFRILPLTRVTPKIIGTCGHFYSTEALVAFRMKDYYMNLKGKILVHIMGTLKLFHEFINEPLQWCDVRFDNLGLSADYPKRFVLMDGDMVYTESKLRATLHERPCAGDSDCTIGDCEARCTSDLTCGDRSNTNLEVFCEKLVRKLFGHTKSTVNKYLAACQESTGNITKRMNELRLTWSWNLPNV